MKTPLTAIEMTGTIDKDQQLKLDGILPISGPKRVRVIVLAAPDEDIDEATWLYAASKNPAFSFLAEPDEDIYELSDGEPFHDEV